MSPEMEKPFREKFPTVIKIATRTQKGRDAQFNLKTMPGIARQMHLYLLDLAKKSAPLADHKPIKFKHEI